MALGKGLNSLLPSRPIPQAEPAVSARPVSVRSVVHRETGDGARVWNIPLSEITGNPDQPRKVFGHQELEELVQSIKQHGILQPITVTERADGGYEIIAGERRYRAAHIAGLATVPALVRAVSEQEKLELALIENIQRQNLNPIEEAFAFQRLMQQFNLTQQQVAEQVGKSRPVIANTVRLLDLPEEIQRALMDGKLSMGKARALLSLTDTQEQLNMFRSFIGEGLTVRDVEKAVAERGPQSRKGSVRRDPNIISTENALEARLGAKVRIHLRGDHGTVEIQFTDRAELRRLVVELGAGM